MKSHGKVVEKAKVPVTIKIRKGWDADHINAVEIAKIAEKNHVAAITIHGRTREEFYTGKADWDIIKRVKDAVSIPVIGNGDVVSFETAEKMFRETGCDAIMIGRASLGNPWIFQEILEKREIFKSKEMMKQMILKHLAMLSKDKGEYIAVREMRKWIAWYIKGLPYATEMRSVVNQIDNQAELIQKIEDFLSK